MAKKKLRDIQAWRIKYILLYLAMIFITVFAIIGTILININIALRIGALIYETIVLFAFIGIPIAIKVISNKEKTEIEYGISKEEQEKFIQQAKNCDIHAK